MAAAKKDILQGWKDIAAYVSRDVRTVKRWEKQRGLPVRRMPGEGRANVYALIPELDGWLSARGTLEAEPEASIEETPAIAEPDEPDLDTVTEVPQTKQPTRFRRSWIYAAVGVLCLAAITAFAVSMRTHRRTQTVTDVPPFDPTQTARTIKYSSRVAGVDALYLRGIYFYEQRTPDTLDRALRCFQDAVARDPGYAPAYAGLAETYNLLREYSMMPEREAYDKAKAAAKHAIELDPNLPEAHAALGFVEFFWDWNAAEAEREFKTSIALDPDSALVHHWYGSMLTHQGRFEESLAQLDLAQRLQPTSTAILTDRAFALGMSGRRNEAADMLQEVITENPQVPAPHYILGILSLIEPRDLPRFLDETRQFATLRRDSQRLQMVDVLETAYRKGGATAMWRAQLEDEERRHPLPNDRTFPMAGAEAVLGLDDDCLRDLKQLADRRDPSMIGIGIDPIFMKLRHDPRFKAVLATIGIQPPARNAS